VRAVSDAIWAFIYEYILRNPYRYGVVGERVLYFARRHAASLVWPVLRTFLAFGLGVPLFLATEDLPGTVYAVLGVLALIAFGWLLKDLVEWLVTFVSVSDRRLYEITGFLRVKVAIMPLSKVTDLTYRQSFVGQVLEYGEIVVESAGQDQALSDIVFIRDPDIVYQLVASLALGSNFEDVLQWLETLLERELPVYVFTPQTVDDRV
jgi:hypothetical protein